MLGFIFDIVIYQIINCIKNMEDNKHEQYDDEEAELNIGNYVCIAVIWLINIIGVVWLIVNR